jgi:hypothetical protein
MSKAGVLPDATDFDVVSATQASVLPAVSASVSFTWVIVPHDAVAVANCTTTGLVVVPAVGPARATATRAYAPPVTSVPPVPSAAGVAVISAT